MVAGQGAGSRLVEDRLALAPRPVSSSTASRSDSGQPAAFLLDEAHGGVLMPAAPR